MNKSIEYKIMPPRPWLPINLPEIWKYRDLLYILAWRDVKVRYKQTIIGIGWAIFQPLLTMVIFTAFFGLLIKVPSDGIPYPIFVYAGLIYWNYFATALTNVSTSLIDNEGLIKKVYFPRLIAPLAAALVPTVDFGCSLVVLFVLMLGFGITPYWFGILMVPLLLLIVILGATGIGLIFAAINVKYRDVRYILPFFIQILLYVTPVIYPVSIIPTKWQFLIFANPLASVTTLARNSLLYAGPWSWHGVIDWRLVAVSVLISAVLLISGLFYFRKSEKFFADIL